MYQITNDKTVTLTSLEVAEMVGKEHKQLLKDIRRYIGQFNESKITPVEFFTESTYKDAKGETRPCYNVTKKGCELIAHKLTGIKGTEFTAKYINRFHDMEERLTTDEQLKATLLLSIYNGGQEAVLSSKQLTELEVKEVTKPLVAKIEEQKPLVDFANQVSNTTSLIDMNQMAKLLKDENISIGRNRLFTILREKEILRSNNEPYQRYIDCGYFKVKEYTYDTPYATKTYIKTLITGKGQIWITEKLRKEFGVRVSQSI